MTPLLEEELKPIEVPAILFICTHNSARSIMAEAIARVSLPGSEVGSAGTTPTGVHPLALTTLVEMGIPTTGLTSEKLKGVLDRGWDLIVTLRDILAGTEPAGTIMIGRAFPHS